MVPQLSLLIFKELIISMLINLCQAIGEIESFSIYLMKKAQFEY